MKKLIIMGIGAHPDDLEMACAGTLAKYADEGADIYMSAACQGDKGHFEIPPRELAAIRSKELKDSAQIIGADVIELKFPDGEIENNLKTRQLFIEAIRKVNPDIIITHPLEDYHADHQIVSRLVIDASFMVGVPHIKTKSSYISKVPSIYFMDTYAGVGFVPDDYVDISKYLDTRLAMISKHKSQLKWLKEHDNMDVIDYVKNSAKYRGFQCGVDFAEGFIKYKTSLRITPTTLLK